MSDDPSDLGMVFAFDDQSASFVNGFELGMVWQEIDGEGRLVVDRGFGEGFPVHAENIETLRRMANAKGYKLEAKPPADGWIAARLTFVGTGKSKPSLSIVGCGTRQ